MLLVSVYTAAAGAALSYLLTFYSKLI